MAFPTSIPAPARFKIQGGAPASVRSAPPAERLAFWRAFVEFAKEAKARELARGLDKYGSPMAPLSQKTIANRRSAMGPADPGAPPLQPAHGLSRTRALFVGEATPDGALFGWSLDPTTGKPWGLILKIHRDGDGVPVRDVIGLSPASIAEANRRAVKWWGEYLAGAAKPPTANTPTHPGGRPPFLTRPVPKYEPKDPSKAAPKRNSRVSQIEINGDVYTLGGGSAAQIRRDVADGKFSGFQTRAELLAERRLKGWGTFTPRAPTTPPPTTATPFPKHRVVHARVDPADVRTPADAARYARYLGAAVNVVDRATAERLLGKKVDSIPAAYEAFSHSVVINPFADAWADDGHPARKHAEGRWAGDSFGYIVHHEMGHHAHRAAIGRPAFSRMTGEAVRPDLADPIKRLVSRYAAENLKEFVAEVYATLKEGRTLPRELLDYFDSLGGVRP